MMTSAATAGTIDPVPEPDIEGSAPFPEGARTLGDVPERRAFYILALLAVAAIVVSLVLNWLWAPALVTTAGGESAASRIARYRPSTLPPLSKSPKVLLPSDVTAYETIDAHIVPGSGDRVAEAVYASYNVNLGMTAQTTVYARVEGLPTASDARARAAEIMKAYPYYPEHLVLDPGVSALAGYDRAANGTPQTYSVVWVTDNYVTWVKTFFQDNPLGTTAMAKKFLVLTGEPVYTTAAVYQRLGIQGSAANGYVHRNDAPVKQSGKKKTQGSSVPEPVTGAP